MLSINLTWLSSWETWTAPTPWQRSQPASRSGNSWPRLPPARPSLSMRLRTMAARRRRKITKNRGLPPLVASTSLGPIPKKVAYLSCTAGRTHFARSKIPKLVAYLSCSTVHMRFARTNKVDDDSVNFLFFFYFLLVWV